MSRRSLRCAFGLVLSLLVTSGCGSTTTTPSTFVVKSGVKPTTRFFSLSEELSFGSRAIIGGTPTRFDATFYAAYLTESAACTSPFVGIADHRPAGLTQDVVGGPTAFEGSPAAATYRCLILEISDVFTFRPDAEAQTANAACSTSADSTFDIHRATETDWKTKDGTAITGAGTIASPAESTSPVKGVTVFVSTDTSAVSGVSPNQVLTLAGPVTVTASTTTLTLYNDITDKISINTDGGTDYCWMEPGVLTME